MSLPVNHKMPGQASIRSFFTPKNPSSVPPPSSSTPTKPPPPPTTQRPPTTTTTPTTQPPSQPTINVPPPRSAPSPRPASLHPQASIVPIQQEHIPALRRVTSLILPINYPDSFYTALSNPETSGAFSRAILWTEPGSTPKVIGGLVCRPEPLPLLKPSGDSPSGLYIQSLVLLSPYRSLGLAAACLEEVVASVTASSYRCETVWAHAWTQNEDGLIWYKKRGFTVAGEIKNYYFKLNPGDAFVLERPIIIDRQPIVEAGMSYASTQQQTRQTIQPSTTTMAANLPLFGVRNNSSQPLPSPPMNGLPAAASPTTNGTSLRAPPPPPPMSSSKSAVGVPPPPTSTSTAQSRPTLPVSGTSFQNLRPETEWNDLPADMHAPAPSSGTSSRSNSSVAANRKKRDRAYPAAAFGAK